MSFLRPDALWLIPAVLGVLLWARHRARRRPRPVTAWLLFARAQAAMPPPPTRRRPVLDDLLLIVPALAAALALARPVLEDASAGVGDRQIAARIPNVGIVACGVDATGTLLVRIDGAGTLAPVTLTVADRAPIIVPADEIPSRHLIEGLVDAATTRVDVRIAMDGDVRPEDDVVVLRRSAGRTSVGFPLTGHDALHRAFAAHPGTDVFRGPGPCRLRVGPGEGEVRLRVAPDGGRDPRAVSGTLTVAGSSLTGELALDAVHVPDPSPYETLASVDGTPLVARAGAELYLLQDPEASRWRDHPTFPLLCAEIVRAVSEPTRMIPEEPIPTIEDVRGDNPSGRESKEAAPVPRRTPLSPWLYALAALAFAVLTLRKRL